MEKIKRIRIVELLKSKDYGAKVNVKGWVRTRRGSKAVNFIALNDGSTIKNIQIVADVEKCYVIRNGRPEMGTITGTGCQLSGMMTAFLCANVEQPLEAAAAAICAMGIAGEIGFEHLREGEGNSTYRNRIIDAIYHMDGNTLEERAKYELR